jgi:hypothetical protein
VGIRRPSLRAGALVAVLLSSILAGTGAAAPEKPAPRPDVGKQIEALAQTQAELQQQIAALREAVSRLGEKITGTADAAAEQRELLAGVEKADKTAHDELAELSRGLYVEVSGVKGDVGLVRGDVQALNGSVESSRLGSGILIAAVIALQIILVLLAIRARR